MNAIAPPAFETENDQANVILLLMKGCKMSNKATKKKLISVALNDAPEAVKAYRHELMLMLFSPLETFNVKPKKTWVMGSSEPTKTWAEAYRLLCQLRSREITGNAAKQAAEDMAAELSESHADLFLRILNKRPDAGMTGNTINEVIPGYIPLFKCALAEPFDPAKADFPCLAQPKLDGVRVLAHVQLSKSQVTYYSRRGLTFSSMEHLTKHCLALAKVFRYLFKTELTVGELDDDLFFDGEVFGENFKESISAVRKKDTAAENTKFHVYDWMRAEDFFAAKSSLSQAKRTEILDRAMLLLRQAAKNEGVEPKLVTVPTRVVIDHEAAVQFYEKALSDGYEGAMLKKPDDPYSFRRSYTWMKMKPEASEDLTVVGWEEGTGKYEGLVGALIVDFKGVEVRVGSGLTDALRASLWAERDALEGRIAEVEYMEVTPDGSLRHPRFVCFRDLPATPGVKV
ncbi:ATP-dependent DNA ligase [Halomonas sp. S2151]|uniref:ATP-dependent DNA ligase n=1 Tax=Halomonas sp. S2151 TaxID=579478 RepID=UPI000695B913|nr:hypothetical protein [Halomonas sp. S2151]